MKTPLVWVGHLQHTENDRRVKQALPRTRTKRTDEDLGSDMERHSLHHLVSGTNFLSHSASLTQNTLLTTSHSLIHLPPAHHSHPPSHIHCSIPGSKLTFSTNLFHHSQLAPTWTAFSDYTGPDLLCSTVFHF